MDEYIQAQFDLHRGVGREGLGEAACSRQNRRLAGLGNTLLPKVLSGETKPLNTEELVVGMKT